MLEINKGYQTKGVLLGVEDMVAISNFYRQACVQEYIAENYARYTEEQAWKLAGDVLRLRDKLDMSEAEALSKALQDYNQGFPARTEEEVCSLLTDVQNVVKKLGAKMELKQPIHFNRQNCLWYGGDIAEITTKDGYRVVISVNGTVRGTYSGKDNEVTVFVNDKYNAGRFYDDLHEYIQDDIMLHAFIDNGSINLDFDNWVEVNVTTPEGKCLTEDCNQDMVTSGDIMEPLLDIEILLQAVEDLASLAS